MTGVQTCALPILYPDKLIQLNKALHVPQIVPVVGCKAVTVPLATKVVLGVVVSCAPVSFVQPPIFSGEPERNRTLSVSNHPPSLVNDVDSLFTPGRNCNFWSGISILVSFFVAQEKRAFSASAALQAFEDFAPGLRPIHEGISGPLPVLASDFLTNRRSLEVP